MAKMPTKEAFLKSLGLDSSDLNSPMWRNEPLWGTNNLWLQQMEGQLLFWGGDKFWGDINLWQSLSFLSAKLAVELLASAAVLAEGMAELRVESEAQAYIDAEAKSDVRVVNTTTFYTDLPPSKIDFWGGNYKALTYITSILIPPNLVNVNLSIKPILRSGEIFSIEYGLGKEPKTFWGDRRFWADATYTFWGSSRYPETYYTMPNSIKVPKPSFVFFKIKTTGRSLAVLEDIKYLFDVEDKVEGYDNIFIPAEVFRLPKPKQTFVDIVNVTGTTQYDEVGLAHSLYFVDRGIRENGLVVEGPAVVLLDINKNLTSGTADITVRGY